MKRSLGKIFDVDLFCTVNCGEEHLLQRQRNELSTKNLKIVKWFLKDHFKTYFVGKNIGHLSFKFQSKYLRMALKICKSTFFITTKTEEQNSSQKIKSQRNENNVAVYNFS